MTVKAVICSLDNLPILREQVRILREDPCVDEIVIVSNGSVDGTNKWLDEQSGLVVVERENNGAGPGRNSGLDAAGYADYYLMLDGGIRPLVGGTEKMLEYLERREDADVIGVEIPDFETDPNKAWRRWPNKILDKHTYRHLRLSHTAYCLARHRCFDGLRFSEDGPFGEAAWGADDDEMAYQWNDAGIVIHVVSCQCNLGKPCTGVHPYRRGSGSFRRLFKETGIWPTQYGSTYEQRVVWLQQNWPQYQPGVQWGIPWLTVVVRVEDDAEEAIKTIKMAHEELRKRRFDKPYQRAWNPYHVMAWCPQNDEFLAWSEPRRLRQHHGDTTVDGSGNIIRRRDSDAELWTGDFLLHTGKSVREGLREWVRYWGIVSYRGELEELLERYNNLHPRQGDNTPPDIETEELVVGKRRLVLV